MLDEGRFQLHGRIPPQEAPAQNEPRSDFVHNEEKHIWIRGNHTYNSITLFFTFFFLWRCGPTRPMASSFLRFLDHTQRRITVGRTPLDEWSARRRDLHLTTHSTHNRQTSMPPVGFEPTISAGERPHTYALDHTATGTGFSSSHTKLIFISFDLMWHCTEV